MKQQFKGSITLDIAARTVTLHDIQLTPDRVLLVVNATVGYIYHNFSIDDPAVITTVVRAPSTSTVWPNMAVGTDTVIHFSDYKDCDTHQNSDAVSVFYEDGVDLGKLIKDESDETQALLQAEFDATQVQLTAFQAEVKAENDETQALLQTEFDATQVQLTAFQAEVKAENDETQALLQTEFDQTQTDLAAFRVEVKAESDETQTILNSKLPTLVSGKIPVLSTDNYSPMNGYSTAITNGPYGPTTITYTKGGVVALVVNLTYDANGKLISVV